MARKDAGLAVALTILTPGLGHVYLESYTRAVSLFLAFVISAALIAVGIGIILTPVVWIYAAYDAHRRA
ncbi:hypothetical protein [Natronorubrum daqingense]|nr:hypothetical protein [Natronorubrum daqingense]APX98750.1 hypothetical protein BB347_18475 [Natronorubrum daqingense]